MGIIDYTRSMPPEDLTINELAQVTMIHPYCWVCAENERNSLAVLREKGWVFGVGEDGSDYCPIHNPYLGTVDIQVPCPICESKDKTCFFCDGELVTSSIPKKKRYDFSKLTSMLNEMRKEAA